MTAQELNDFGDVVQTTIIAIPPPDQAPGNARVPMLTLNKYQDVVNLEVKLNDKVLYAGPDVKQASTVFAQHRKNP